MGTWLQALPLFFAVGGFAHARALDSPYPRGGTYGTFVRSLLAGERVMPAVVGTR